MVGSCEIYPFGCFSAGWFTVFISCLVAEMNVRDWLLKNLCFGKRSVVVIMSSE